MNQRYKIMLRLLFISSPMKRAEYMRKKGCFHSMGEHVSISSRKLPLYSRLISIGNNVWLASGVEFITHDVTHYMLKNKFPEDREKFREKVGCIKIEDNVFAGAGSKLMYDVHIGSNVIIAAGAVVTKDVPDNTVVGGVPAKRICSFEEYLEKREKYFPEHTADNSNMSVSPQCEEEMWRAFEAERQ